MQGWNELEWDGGEHKMSIESRVSMHGQRWLVHETSGLLEQ